MTELFAALAIAAQLVALVLLVHKMVGFGGWLLRNWPADKGKMGE